jgi:uncharacterized protein (DUF697 family)
MGLRMAARLNDVIHRLARHLNKIFSGLSGTISLTPIIFSDVYILLVIQAILVSLIASLSGRDITLDTAKEFVLSMGGIVGAGYTFRVIAQQGSKLVNIVLPGVGSGFSAAVATSGTWAMGNAAISYYLDGNTIKDVKKKFEKERDDGERK